jgi:cation diffusion facilitator family transporter
MRNDERYALAKKVTLIGAVTNAVLGFIKLCGGIAFHSHALCADAIHSFSDLITDAMVVCASKYGSQDADEGHPYGHKRIETAATLILALLLILAGLGIAWDALNEIIQQQGTTPGLFTLPIAALSILANELLFHYTKRMGTRIHSDLLIANAWHHRSDAASSLIVFIGLIASITGWVGFDALAAIIVGILIIKMGLNYGWNSVKELVDAAVEPELLLTIEQAIQSITGVHKIHQLRTRMMGGDIFVDVHILVSPTLSVSEGHYIAQQVHRTLLTAFERIKDVTVHVDPEDDETSSPSFHLPNRKTLENALLEPWQKEYPEVEHWVLHYLNSTLSIDLIVTPSFNKQSDLIQRIHHDIIPYQNISHIRLLSHTATLAILPNSDCENI